MKKIFAWEQYKYMIVILVLCISHFLVVGLLFGFEALLNDYSFLYYIQLSLGLSLLAPLLFVLTIRFHDDIRILFDGKTMIVFLVYSICRSLKDLQAHENLIV